MCVVAGDPWAVEGTEPPEKVVAGVEGEVREEELRERWCGRRELFAPIISLLLVVFDLVLFLDFQFVLCQGRVFRIWSFAF